MTIVYHGPNNGEGFTVYHNGIGVAHDNFRSASSHNAGPGSMVIGRTFTDVDDEYASVCVDELTMWNRQLSFQEIQDIFNMY